MKLSEVFLLKKKYIKPNIIKDHIMNWYCTFLNFMHCPLIIRDTRDPYHQVFSEFQALVQSIKSPVVLEIGARNVSGITRRHLFPTAKHYIGFDIYPGDGVDVIGDAHQFSTYFSSCSIDAIFSTSVFEHLVFPWKVVLEINRVLKPGGYVFVSTHPTWPPHELPWDFWRYPVAGLAHLFIPATGFKIISAIEGLPCRVYSLVTDPPTRGLFKFKMNMGVGIIAKKISDYDSSRLKWEIDINAVVNSQYPLPCKNSI